MTKKKTFGTPPKYLYRKDDPETSEEAAYSVDTSKNEKLVYDEVCAAGKDGIIPDEIRAKHPALPYSTVTARPCALERKGLIVRGPDKRKGKSGRNQFVMRATAI